MIMFFPPVPTSFSASDDDVEQFKTPEDRAEELEILRAEEAKWGRRSLAALVLLSLFAASIATLGLFFAGKHGAGSSGICPQLTCT